MELAPGGCTVCHSCPQQCQQGGTRAVSMTCGTAFPFLLQTPGFVPMNYKLMGPDVPPGFPSMSVGGGTGPGTGRSGSSAQGHCLCVQRGPVAFCGHGKAQLGCAGGMLAQGHGSVLRAGEASGTHHCRDAEPALGSRGKGTHPIWWAGGTLAARHGTHCHPRTLLHPASCSALGFPISQPISHGQTGSFLPCDGRIGQNSSLPGLSNSVFLFLVIANKLPWPRGIPAWLLRRRGILAQQDFSCGKGH